ncbi:hypothetical protein ACFQZU_17815, partial [Streptomonospora algeriensis]
VAAGTARRRRAAPGGALMKSRRRTAEWHAQHSGDPLKQPPRFRYIYRAIANGISARILSGPVPLRSRDVRVSPRAFVRTSA